MRLSIGTKELTLDIQKIVVDLKNEKERLDRAIAALEDTIKNGARTMLRISKQTTRSQSCNLKELHSQGDASDASSRDMENRYAP
jgi:hypothetical protein